MSVAVSSLSPTFYSLVSFLFILCIIFLSSFEQWNKRKHYLRKNVKRKIIIMMIIKMRSASENGIEWQELQNRSSVGKSTHNMFEVFRFLLWLLTVCICACAFLFIYTIFFVIRNFTINFDRNWLHLSFFPLHIINNSFLHNFRSSFFICAIHTWMASVWWTEENNIGRRYNFALKERRTGKRKEEKRKGKLERANTNK